MKFEVYLKEKAYAKTGRKKVAYVVAKTAEEAKGLALKRAENAAFMIDGTPRRAS